VVAGIGASAGGLEAFSTLLEQLPLDTGMAFVLVQHLDPHHPSLLTQLLSAAACGVLDVVFGPPLGSFGHTFENAEVALDRNDSLVLYTDGVTEARQGIRMFGEARLLEAVSDLHGHPAQAVADGVADAARAFGGGRLRDDLQVVVLRLT
jgi:hypothetical protein